MGLADEINSFPGLGITSRIRFIWRPVKVFGIGALFTAHYSTHKGGPYKDDPDTTRLPFELAEPGLGIQVYIYF